MHEHEAPQPADAGEETADAVEDHETDEELDGFESDLDAVASALDALDADDLDAAEALVAGLADDPAPEAVDG